MRESALLKLRVADAAQHDVDLLETRIVVWLCTLLVCWPSCLLFAYFLALLLACLLACVHACNLGHVSHMCWRSTCANIRRMPAVPLNPMSVADADVLLLLLPSTPLPSSLPCTQVCNCVPMQKVTVTLPGHSHPFAHMG
jgi:hypothetical protein